MGIKNSIRILSFPAGEIARISDGLKDFVKVFEHDKLALHAHLPAVDVLQQHTRARQQFLLQPRVVYYFPDLAEHDLVGFVQQFQQDVHFLQLVLIPWILLDIPKHLVYLRPEVPVQILCLQPTLLLLVLLLSLP